MITYSKCLKLRTILKTYRIPYRTLSGLNCWDEDLSLSTKKKIEKHWGPKLTYPKYDENDTTREKYYVLSMFPYPSGNLHMGHVRVYTISDSIARFQRMNNKKVIHPIGWDAFGLPAENAAIERNIAPEEWTKQNISHMREQLQKFGCTFDWDREISTCDPKYYRWTQELFIKLYESGLAYQKEALVNWDPVDKTVLADEQVDQNGCSWRSGALVEKKLLRQWFIKTTRFAKALQDGLDDSVLQDWRDVTKIQKHWIGECNGVAFDFPLDNSNYITLWTANAAYIEDAAFVALSSANILADSEGEHLQNGTKRLKIVATNPFNGKSLPIFVTDQVTFIPGTDSYLGIPQICEHDQEFCNKFNINFALHDNLAPQDEAAKHVSTCKKAKEMNIGGHSTSAKLRDWLISRQRYWGTPIPMINCTLCGTCPVPREQLPVVLPKISDVTTEGGNSPLLENKEWLHTVCPKCGGEATRETDTMDTFVDSSWYFLRYIDPHNSTNMFSISKAQTMTPVDLYVGGKEHAAMHLYYARFVSHFLHSLGMLPEREPFKRLLVQGMVMGMSYRLKGTGQYITADKVKVIDKKKNKAVHLDTQQQVVATWEKMSKSKQNGVDPSEMLDEYGIDTTRLLVLADVAPTSHRHWNKATFPGILNWQKRLWLIMQRFLNNRQNGPPRLSEAEFKVHEDYIFDSRNYYLKGVTFNYCTAQQHSVAISKMQGLTSSLFKVPMCMTVHGPQYERALGNLIVVLAPFAPHFAAELWNGFVSAPNRLHSCNRIRWDRCVLEQPWPDVDNHYKLDLICKINGRDVVTVKIPRCEIEKLSDSEALNVALHQKEIQDNLLGKGVTSSNYHMYVGYRGEINISAKAESAEKMCINLKQ